ncbi:MAG: hypothetical protein Q8Q81_19730 [Oxalobacteraceae bacterium]|nr:hypothetical protein [Oxalobacteraceae bacterium]
MTQNILLAVRQGNARLAAVAPDERNRFTAASGGTFNRSKTI